MSTLLTRLTLAGILLGAGATFAGFAPALPAPASARPEESGEYKKIIDSAGEAVVTIKFVMKSPDDQGFGDAEEEVLGVVIAGNGLVLCSNWTMGGAAGMFGGGAGPKPQDIKVLIGEDTEGKKAKLIAHDSDLDLAWIKLDEEPASPLKFLDLEKGVPASVGQRVFLLSRLDKYFERAHVINEGRVRGVTQKPRHLYAPGGNLLAEREDLGMPVFNTDAAVIGIFVVQVPDKETMESTENLGPRPMILPVADAAKATKRALESVNDPAKKDGAEAPKEPEKPAETKPEKQE